MSDLAHGTYVSGWKFDWEESKKEYDAMLEAGRETAAAFVADPGITHCPVCGEHHWREFEVFLCSRCGAQITDSRDGNQPTAGPPTKPEMVRNKYHEGMRIRWNPKEKIKYYHSGGSITETDDEGCWLAGKIPIGCIGSVVALDQFDPLIEWRIIWDRIKDREPYIFGTFSQWIDDRMEVV